MKRKVFKYKFIYWIILLLNIIISISFLVGVNNRIDTKDFESILDVFSFTAVTLISILSLISLVMLIRKNKNSTIVFSVVVLLILLTISVFLSYSIFVVKDFGENKADFYTAPIPYLIIFGVLFLIHQYKSKDNFEYLEIEEIGKQS
ncbi:hypothetical protein [Chryseobacterium sp.]|uniref:hypothetical protein n=1 Tax=Chryseobacterium sp. TaxID=1871047 RepID=UPI002FCA3D32